MNNSATCYIHRVIISLTVVITGLTGLVSLLFCAFSNFIQKVDWLHSSFSVFIEISGLKSMILLFCIIYVIGFGLLLTYANPQNRKFQKTGESIQSKDSSL